MNDNFRIIPSGNAPPASVPQAAKVAVDGKLTPRTWNRGKKPWCIEVKSKARVLFSGGTMRKGKVV